MLPAEAVVVSALNRYFNGTMEQASAMTVKIFRVAFRQFHDALTSKFVNRKQTLKELSLHCQTDNIMTGKRRMAFGEIVCRMRFFIFCTNKLISYQINRKPVSRSIDNSDDRSRFWYQIKPKSHCRYVFMSVFSVSAYYCFQVCN